MKSIEEAQACLFDAFKDHVTDVETLDVVKTKERVLAT